MKKLGIYFLSLTLMLSLTPVQPIETFAEEVDPEFLDEEIVLFAESKDGEIDLFENLLDEDPILSVPDQVKATLLNVVENDEFSLIRYTYIIDQDEEVQIEGYVHNSTIVPLVEADQFREERDLKLQEEDIEIDEDEVTEEKLEKVDVDSNSDKSKRNAYKVEIVDEKAQQINAVHNQEIKELKNGVRDKRVVQLKKDLAKLGFPVPGNGTSLFGPDTERKVKEFQKYYGIKETGTITDETQKKIEKILASPLQKGKRHKDTVQLKKDLAFLNFPVPGNGTTLYGTQTEKRVKEFQKKYGLVINGIADEVTLAKIEELKKVPLSNGIRREDVKTLKKNLAKLGFKVPGNGTNLYGKETTKKVTEFQKYYGINQTGTVTAETQKKIEQILASPLQKGKRHKDTVQLKKDLAFLNFSVPGNGTTLYGTQTERRVQEFQKKYGLVVNGIADEVTLAKITELKKNPLSKGMRRGDVVTLKKDLAKFGFKVPGNGTNYFGSDTEAKVKEFQKYYGIKQTGTVTDETKNLLNTPLQKGNRHQDTVKLKKDLKELGFTVPGNGTNYYGKDTENKVKEFQTYYRINKVNGIADNVTLAKIKSILNSPLQNGKRDKRTIQLKIDLAKIGYPVPGNGTNYYGKDTEKKVKEFQKDYNLAVSGIADEITLDKIAELVKKVEQPINITESTNYNITLSEALDIQMVQLNQTDKHRNKEGYVHSDYLRYTGQAEVITKTANVRSSASTNSTNVDKLKKGETVNIFGYVDNGGTYAGSKTWYKISYKGSTRYIHSSRVKGNNAIATTTVNVRSGKGTSYPIYGHIGTAPGEIVKIISHGVTWHRINTAWIRPTRDELKKFLNPNNNDKFQHLRLDSSVNVSASELNKVLKGKGELSGQGQAFIDAGKKHGINEAYLIAHAFLETGNGTSTLSKGVKYKGKTVYNMFGIGAVDSDPTNGGAKTAYENGWFSPEAAIIGGAEWIGNGYIYNEHSQNTLYKMKWNPNMYKGYAWKQYATDIEWANKQTHRIKEIYEKLDNPSYHYDIAKYK